MRTRTPVCGVCTGFTRPRNPAKFAKKMWGFPSTAAIEVATMGEAVTSISLVFFRRFKNSACESVRSLEVAFQRAHVVRSRVLRKLHDVGRLPQLCRIGAGNRQAAAL